VLKIPEDFKRYILKEFDFTARKMKEEKDPSMKLYYFSALYAALERYMRYSLDPQVLLVHAVLQLCYSTLKGRLDQIARGDTTIDMPPEFSVKLVEYALELRDEIAAEKDTYVTLEKFVHLAYQTTGAGYYTRRLLETSGEPAT